MDWNLPDDMMPPQWEPLRRDVLLKGWLLIVVTDREGAPLRGKKVTIRGCGFV